MDWKQYLEVFAKNLLNSSSFEVEEDNTKKMLKLIRRHDKNLSKNGDFSCPSNTVWQQVLQDENICMKNENELLQIQELMLDGIEVTKKSSQIMCRLNRQAFMSKFFQEFREIKLTLNKSKSSNHKIQVQCQDKYELTNIRCLQLQRFCQNLLALDCLNLKIENLVISSNSQIKQAIIVGPVLDTKSKKKSEESFLETYKKVFNILNSISKEREMSNQSEAKRLKNVHTITCAEFQLGLLGTSINQPTVIDPKAAKNATFVLYNHARICQLMQSIGYDQNDEDRDINVELLKEEEEWELVFAFLSNYLNLLQDMFEFQNDVKVGRLCQFLINMCNVFSRYYNRVHIIKEVEHLKPVQDARMHLVSVIRKILEHGLMLLDIPSLGLM